MILWRARWICCRMWYMCVYISIVCVLLLYSLCFSLPSQQVWSLLPAFCTDPTDLCQCFRSLAKTLGTALMERSDLRGVVCHALQLLIERNRHRGEYAYTNTQYSVPLDREIDNNYFRSNTHSPLPRLPFSITHNNYLINLDHLPLASCHSR